MQKKNGGIVMVSLSMGVLQCNLLANVSTVAGKPTLSSLSSSDMNLKLGRGTSEQLTHSTHPLAVSKNPNRQYTAPCCHVELGLQSG